MRFNLVDRILGMEDRRLLRAVKQLTLGEEYLADHFPQFPVMPGVLMLEALAETGAWLLRIRDDFRHSIIALRDARNVKYGTFMEPGRRMILTAELTEEAEDRVTFKGKGEVDGNLTVSARFTLGRYNLRERNRAWQVLDERIIEHFRDQYRVLAGAEASPAATTSEGPRAVANGVGP
jgi:3-hydroxyacyl-[acyl-carrier-protein] dehydratase